MTGTRRAGALAAILILVLLLAAALRLAGLRDFPQGFFCDEASIGYNAWTVSRTGRDEHGERFPLFFRAFGEYKNPVYIYCAVPAVALLGLDEFSTRLPAALFGILTVWFTFLLFRELFTPREGVLAALMLAVSAWHIHFSRIAFELISFHASSPSASSSSIAAPRGGPPASSPAR
ncbi:MAG: glycosyltransferase family 39 protein, partial [bacterium]|nr:glycosyltransferase family 39 protein [bacterium]